MFTRRLRLPPSWSYSPSHFVPLSNSKSWVSLAKCSSLVHRALSYLLILHGSIAVPPTHLHSAPLRSSPLPSSCACTFRCVFLVFCFWCCCYVEFVLEHFLSVSVCLCLFPTVLRPSILFLPTILSFSIPSYCIRCYTWRSLVLCSAQHQKQKTRKTQWKVCAQLLGKGELLRMRYTSA